MRDLVQNDMLDLVAQTVRVARGTPREGSAEDTDLVRKHPAVVTGPLWQWNATVEAEQRLSVGGFVLDNDLDVADRVTGALGSESSAASMAWSNGSVGASIP